MLITKDYLKNLSPCENRYKHYLQNYKDWQGTLDEFLDLPELTYEDKRWVFVRLIDKNKLRFVAADFAERVLHYYETKYPNDDRPRKAIEAARNNNADAYAAARAAADARAAAVCAADFAAAYDAAYAASCAASCVAYDAAAAAYDAACAAVYAADRKHEEQAQIEIMKRYAREALNDLRKGGRLREVLGHIATLGNMFEKRASAQVAREALKDSQ